MNSFSNFHPLVLFLYFCGVVLVTMLSLNPVIIAFSAFGAILFLFGIKAKGLGKALLFYLVFFVIIALSNPIFVHSGMTALFFINGNAITLEAIFYGVSAGLMLCSVMLWCRGLSEVFTSDKVLYLFGRLSPKIAVIISMSLRFVPDFKRQLKRIHESQKTLGLYSGENFSDRLMGGFRVISALITWAIENAVETSQSMTARGFSLHGKTSFSLFCFTLDDGVFLSLSALALSGAIVGITALSPETTYYPIFSGVDFSSPSVLTYSFSALLFLLPSILEAKESLRWKLLKSKI